MGILAAADMVKRPDNRKGESVFMVEYLHQVFRRGFACSIVVDRPYRRLLRNGLQCLVDYAVNLRRADQEEAGLFRQMSRGGKKIQRTRHIYGI